jgi:hypothetical protein
MRSARLFKSKCFFVAWVFGWVTAIYVPSVLITVAGLSPLTTGSNFFSDVFAVADEVAPAAKLAFAILFGIFLILVPKVENALATTINMALAAAAMLLVVALIPEEWSRGFGIGLAGTRFAALPTAIYFSGGLLSGFVFSVSEARCRARSTISGG